MTDHQPDNYVGNGFFQDRKSVSKACAYIWYHRIESRNGQLNPITIIVIKVQANRWMRNAYHCYRLFVCRISQAQTAPLG